MFCRQKLIDYETFQNIKSHFEMLSDDYRNDRSKFSDDSYNYNDNSYNSDNYDILI